MQASSVPVKGTALNIVVQGFKGSEEHGFPPYVFVAVNDGSTLEKFEGEITPENAHILSEEIRKHAEFASAEQGE